MKKCFSVLLFLYVSLAASAENWNPEADPKAQVIAGDVRFTVLTPQMIRMEWSADSLFEDNASLAIVNRRLDVPDFKVSKTNSKVVIKTSALTLTYKRSGRFSADNLSVEFEMGGKKHKWCPGMSAEGNLKGTIRTLDRADGWNTVEPFGQGLVSRDGWVVIDDSDNHLLIPDDSRWGEWVACRSDVQRQDWYLLAYGHDYKRAIGDFTLVGGRVPLPPRYVFGYWWSRFWQYSDGEFNDLVRMMRSLDIPIDVMVVDMDWHETWGLTQTYKPKDASGEPRGWTGYTWQKELFPSPENFLHSLHDQGLKVTLNLHPASGIQPFEQVYDDFAAAYGWDEKGEYIPFRIDEKKWAETYFDTVLRPMERMGVDFWWLDWQQWKQSRYTPNLSNTFWLNHTFFRDMEMNSSSRPLIYHRWGGLGNHRYQVAFSGDTFATWATLEFLPYFTSTASNVCYGYWGHDIGGHLQRYGKTDPQLYTRWLQYGVFTPIFKTHSTKRSNIERRFWMFPEYFDAMRKAVRLRYTLAPYIYNAARRNYDTGIAMCRPMYYDYPEDEEAYAFKQQHMFGDEMIVTSISVPVDSVTGLAPKTVWFPSGSDWFDMATGRMYHGGECDTLYYTINENPYYVKAASVIPMYPADIENLQSECDELILTVVPGDGNSRIEYYEDDGIGKNYDTEFCITPIEVESSGKSSKITVMPRIGEYDGMLTQRRYEIRFLCVFPPRSVKIDGQQIPYSRFAGSEEWTYDGHELAVVIHTDFLPCDRPVVFECEFDDYAAANRERLYGKPGMFGRFDELTPEFKIVQGDYDSYLMLPVEYLRVSQTPSFITENPDGIVGYLDDFDYNMPLMIRSIAEKDYLGDGFRAKLFAQIQNR